MTINITGTTSVVNQTLQTIYPYLPYNYPRVSVTDTATQTVTLTVTQSSILHSNPGAANDVNTPVQPGAFTLGFYANGGAETNPPTITANSFTVTGPINSTNVGAPTPSSSSSLYGPVAYSPTASLGELQVTEPSIALVGNQILETDLTLTATDSTGGIATQVTKYLFTNPVQASIIPSSNTLALHSAIRPLSGTFVTNANDHVNSLYVNGSYTTTYGSTTVTVTQANILHTDPALNGGDQRIPEPAGTLTFIAPTGTATNLPSFDPTTGTLVATGTITAPSSGVSDPVDYPSGYAPHAYSPIAVVSNLAFTPASSIRLSGNETLETVFTETVTDGTTGSSQIITHSQIFTNPIHLNSYANNVPLPVYGSPFTPFGNGQASVQYSGTGSVSAVISQTSFIHTDPGAADDQRIAVGPGVLSGNTTSAVLTTTPAGLTTIYGSVADVNTVLLNLSFTPARVTLTGNQTLETDFKVIASDSFGDFDTVTRTVTEALPALITVNGLSISQSSGSLTVGQMVVLTVGLSASVTIAANVLAPVLTLNDGGRATYDPAISTSSRLAFRYTVGAADTTTAGLAINGLLNGGAISGVNGGALTLSNGALYGPLGSGAIAVAGSSPTTTAPNTPTTTTAPIMPATTASVYRFFDSNAGTHFFTSSIDERNTLLATRSDLVEETNGFGAVASNAPNAVAVYRFFDTVHGTQFITSNANERDAVQASRPDLSFEAGDVFYEHSVQQTGDVSVYRFFDTKLGTHFYTGNQSEHDAIATPGGAGYRADLISEGVAFYAPSGTFK